MQEDAKIRLDEARNMLDYIIRTSGIRITHVRLDESRNGRRYVDARVLGRMLFITHKALDIMSFDELAALVSLKLALHTRTETLMEHWGFRVLGFAHFALILFPRASWTRLLFLCILAIDLTVTIYAVRHYRRSLRTMNEPIVTPATFDGIDQKVIQSAVWKMMEFSPNAKGNPLLKMREEMGDKIAEIEASQRQE